MTSKMSVPADFRNRYRERGGSCGDDVATLLAQHTRGDDGKPDPAKLRALAERNGVWQDRYAALNPGQQRMNDGNRLRAMARRGEAIEWEEVRTRARAREAEARARSLPTRRPAYDRHHHTQRRGPRAGKADRRAIWPAAAEAARGRLGRSGTTMPRSRAGRSLEAAWDAFCAANEGNLDDYAEDWSDPGYRRATTWLVERFDYEHGGTGGCWRTPRPSFASWRRAAWSLTSRTTSICSASRFRTENTTSGRPAPAFRSGATDW